MTSDKRGGTQKSGMGKDRKQEMPSDRPRRHDASDEAKDSVAHSLRQAYQQTIAEDVPDEMLELLKKLG
jgi:hypothetical protein